MFTTHATRLLPFLQLEQQGLTLTGMYTKMSQEYEGRIAAEKEGTFFFFFVFFLPTPSPLLTTSRIFESSCHTNKKVERFTKYLNRIMREIESKAPELAKLRAEHQGLWFFPPF